MSINIDDLIDEKCELEKRIYAMMHETDRLRSPAYFNSGVARGEYHLLMAQLKGMCYYYAALNKRIELTGGVIPLTISDEGCGGDQ